MFPTFDEYCSLIADLPNQFPSIQISTLSAYTIGPFVAEIAGRLTFESGYVLDIWELLDLERRRIRSYSYELDRNEERIWWYDPTEHPNDPSLRSSSPHHKHIAPDIKHHRIPAPEISFSRPNLPNLIEQVEHLLRR
ncbi:MAG: hypothetical protein K1X65_18430 [Caldilineales bacterium]|nr:hypothetical protein [Caldilineales bacterium]